MLTGFPFYIAPYMKTSLDFKAREKSFSFLNFVSHLILHCVQHLVFDKTWEWKREATIEWTKWRNEKNTLSEWTSKARKWNKINTTQNPSSYRSHASAWFMARDTTGKLQEWRIFTLRTHKHTESQSANARARYNTAHSFHICETRMKRNTVHIFVHKTYIK